MAFDSTLVAPENLVAKHPNGHTLVPAQLVDLGDGKYKYVFRKSPYTAEDVGIWEVWTTDDHKVVDQPARKITEFEVRAISTTEYAVVVPWSSIAVDSFQESDPVALAKLDEAKQELEAKIAAIPGGPDLTEIQSKLADLDTSKAEKTKLAELTTAVEDLSQLVALGATDDELAAATKKVNDAITAIEAKLPIATRTVYTLATAIDLKAGDDLVIDGVGDIKLPADAPDGLEFKISDPDGKVDVGRNSIIPAAGDKIGAGQGSAAEDDATPLSWTMKAQLGVGGFLRIKYRASLKTWQVTASITRAMATQTTQVADTSAITKSVEDLSAVVAGLPTNATLTPIKADITKLKADLATVNSDKADQASLDKTNAAVKAVEDSLKVLAALPPDVTQAELDAAVADYTAKLKTANDAITATKQQIDASLPITPGKTTDLGAVNTTSSGISQGGTLADAPFNMGTGVFGFWGYVGDATSGVMDLSITASPSARQIEGNWRRTRANSVWRSWAVAPRADDFQTKTGSITAITGESWTVADGQAVSMSYVDATKTIKLKPATDWSKVPQPDGSGFTVPAKPASGVQVVEYRVDPGKGAWVVVAPPVDPIVTELNALKARVTALEGVDTAYDGRLDTLESVNYDLERYALDNGKLYTTVESLGLNVLVHLRADGKIELANDKDINKPADGIVLASTAANGTTKVYGSGAKVSDLGQTGSLAGARFYTGTSGAISTSPIGTGRLVQEIAVFDGSKYLLSFVDRGYWLA